MRTKEGLALLGGSFDPIHEGHLHLAVTAREALHLDRVVLLPAFHPPHKLDRGLTDPVHRLAMIRLAMVGRAWLILDEGEIERGGISYTVDTVRRYWESGPGRALYFIIGSDTFVELHTWRSIDRIVQWVTFLVVPRDEGLTPAPPPELETLLKGAVLRTRILNVPPLPISSTGIRQRVAAGASIKGLVPEPVERYIEEHGLYRGS